MIIIGNDILIQTELDLQNISRDNNYYSDFKNVQAGYVPLNKINDFDCLSVYLLADKLTGKDNANKRFEREAELHIVAQFSGNGNIKSLSSKGETIKADVYNFVMRKHGTDKGIFSSIVPNLESARPGLLCIVPNSWYIDEIIPYYDWGQIIAELTFIIKFKYEVK